MRSSVSNSATPAANLGESLLPERAASLAGNGVHASRVWVAYLSMLVIALGLFIVIWRAGAGLGVPHGSARITAPPGTPHLLAHVLLALALIVAFARITGLAFQRLFGQPQVIGEIVAGLILGPSVLGAIAPEVSGFLLPVSIGQHLGALSKIGIVLFMFLVGLELDFRLLRGNSHAAIMISHASILIPMLLGCALALVIFPIYASPTTEFAVFGLFLGVSLSVTAFPVLALILNARGIQSTSLGVTALSCAAADDATAWCLLAFVSGVAQAKLGQAGLTLALTVLYVIFMLVAVRPLLAYLTRRIDAQQGKVSLTTQALVFAGMLLSAVATEAIGIHALFGAFLFGAVISHESVLARHLRLRLEDFVTVLLLPVFFAFSGLRTRIDLMSGLVDWFFCGVIILVATLGKFGGSFIAARIAGLGWRESSAIGVLMNTRGLMELIVLNVGLEMGVLSPTLFTMLVLMALVTTFLTTPVLSRLLRVPSGDLRRQVAQPG
jgi:Kef-type K+ transport system membrane component KefB